MSDRSIFTSFIMPGGHRFTMLKPKAMQIAQRAAATKDRPLHSAAKPPKQTDERKR